MELKVFSALEEQSAVRFTGRINVLSSFNHQYLGHALFLQGNLVSMDFQGNRGLKALYQLCLQEHALQSFNYVVEPEVVETTERQFSHGIPDLRRMLERAMEDYQSTLKLRPPESVRILVDPDFLEDSLPVTRQEFTVLTTLTQWNKAYDIYQHCPLLDHEITLALVNLRKKSALKIVATKLDP
jgi:hypothetical protein